MFERGQKFLVNAKDLLIEINSVIPKGQSIIKDAKGNPVNAYGLIIGGGHRVTMDEDTLKLFIGEVGK